MRAAAAFALAVAIPSGVARAQEGEVSSAPPAPTPVTAAVPLPGAAWHGFVATTYRWRFTHDDADQDVWQVAGLDVGDSTIDGWQAHVLGRWLADIDGDRRTTGYAPFDELADVRAGAVRGFVHEAWVDLAAIPALAHVRVGRQSLIDVPEARQIDGAEIATKPCPYGGVRLGGYAGVPVRQYDRATGWMLAGAWIGAAPVPWAEARLDWMHAEERDDSGPNRDDLWGGFLRLTAAGWGTLTARHTRIGGAARDARVELAGTAPRAETQVFCAYIEQRATITTTTVLGFDELATAGFPLVPYRQLQGRVTQPLGAPLALFAGVDVRRVTDDDDVGAYNRDFDRWQAGATVQDWPLRGARAEVDWSLWDSPRHRFWTLGGGLGYERAKRFALSAGTAFQLYATDTFTGVERERVRTWYCEARIWLHGGLDLRARYAFEEDDWDRYHRVEARCTWRF